MKILEYASMKNGLLIHKPIQPLQDAMQSKPYDGTLGPNGIRIYPREKQNILGFGGAFTQSSAYLYHQMSEKEKRKALELLFGESGLKYNFCRICIGSCDFSLGEYSYIKDDDTTLASFNIAEDKKYVIPFIKDAMAYAKEEVLLMASPWSPPAFMKENGKLTEGTKLKKEYYRLYAAYIVKFIEAYAEEGIKISILTLQNEPSATQTWESCFFSPEDEAAFCDVLYNTLKEKGLEVKLLCWDHNKGSMYPRASVMYPQMQEKIWGMAFHWYDGYHFDDLSLMCDAFPDKVLVGTEFCTSEVRVPFEYNIEILNDLRCGAAGILEWNLILDEHGGPYHHRETGCIPPVSWNTQTGDLSVRNTYAQMYMFSHFIKRHARALYASSPDCNIQTLACRNPDGTIVSTVLNCLNTEKTISICYQNEAFPITLYAGETATLLLRE